MVAHGKANLSHLELARRGEEAAARYLRAKGYRVVERNYRGRAGEIDLIAEHGADLVFIEVKTRTSADFQRPIEAVTSAKQRRIIGTAQAYLRERVGRERRYRFDVVEVMMSPQGRIESIEITAGAFSAGG